MLRLLVFICALAMVSSASLNRTGHRSLMRKEGRKEGRKQRALHRRSEALTDESARARARQELFDEHGGREQLCNYFGWAARPENETKPQLFFGTIVGNNGQDDVYELLFSEIYPYVSRIIALDPSMAQHGFPRNYSFDSSAKRWQKFESLRHIHLESPVPGGSIGPAGLAQSWSEEQRANITRPGHRYNEQQALEEWTRAQLALGLRTGTGDWDMQPDDIVVVADSDEIPLRETLVALTECESPVFARVRRMLKEGADPKEACAKNAKVIMQSQQFEWYMDCPTVAPAWWHPDAILASCIMDGGIDLEDVRTNSSGPMTSVIAARHIHNFGMSNDDVMFKYSHYAEERVQGMDAGLDAATIDEMRWRACDSQAPDFSGDQWFMNVRPSNDYLLRGNKRGYSLPPEKRRGVERPFVLLKEMPELRAKTFWKGYAEYGNRYVGRKNGTNHFEQWAL